MALLIHAQQGFLLPRRPLTAQRSDLLQRSSSSSVNCERGCQRFGTCTPVPVAYQQRDVSAAASSSPDAPAAAAAAAPAPPPYSKLSVPVYSLATVDAGGSHPTMNLMIYASPISLTPRHYAIGLYQNTLSRENMLATKRGVLQILGEQHAHLFQLLGKTSGRDVDKLAQLAEQGFAVQDWRGIPIIADSCGVMELEFATEPYNAGDHEVAICRVVDYQTLSADSRPLSTGYLRELGLY